MVMAPKPLRKIYMQRTHPVSSRPGQEENIQLLDASRREIVERVASHVFLEPEEEEDSDEDGHLDEE